MLQINYLVNKYLIIDSLPLFSDLSILQKQSIASRCQIVEFKKGEIVYKEGDPPDYFYCMVNGRAEIYHPSSKTKTHKEQRIECVRKGDYFGSISSLTGKSHTVSVRALNDSVALVLSTKDFNYILRKIPKLAVFLSHSLSRRLGRKGIKEIFESKIIAIYSISDNFDSSHYTIMLGDTLKKESGKKIFVVQGSSMYKKKNVAAKLSSLTANYHYVLVNIQNDLNDINFEILKQSDVCHILTPSNKDFLHKTARLIKRLEKSLAKYSKQNLSVILKEDMFYAQTSYDEKFKILSKGIFASLPEHKLGYKKAIKRIAREISGVLVGLALGSGAAMGIAHIGVLKILEEKKVPIDTIAATSMGALVAALWAVGFSANEIEKLALGFKSKLRTLFLLDPALPIRGLIKGRAVRKVLKHYLGNKTFFDIKLPLKIVACDIKKRSQVVIDKGSLVDAVMASIAIPGVFEPVEPQDGTQLVDGGIVNPLPVSVLSKAGIKRIIAVNTLPSPQDIVRIRRKRLNIYDIIVNSFQAMEFAIALNSSQQADVYIKPIPKLADWYEFYKVKAFIKTGYSCGKDKIPEIKKLISK